MNNKTIKPIIHIEDSQCPICFNFLCIKERSITMYSLDISSNATQEYTMSTYDTFCPVCGYKSNYSWIPTTDGFKLNRDNKKIKKIIDGNLDLSRNIINKTLGNENPLGDNYV